MSTHAEEAKNTNTPPKPVSSTAEIINALKYLKPSGRTQKAAKFAELFDVIEELLAKDVYQKDIIAVLTKHGLPLAPATFKEYYEDEKKRREEKKALASPPPNEAPIPSAIDSESPHAGDSTVQVDEGVEHVDAEDASGSKAQSAIDKVAGGAA